MAYFSEKLYLVMAYFEKYLCSKMPKMAYFENENGLFWLELPGHPDNHSKRALAKLTAILRNEKVCDPRG